MLFAAQQAEKLGCPLTTYLNDESIFALHIWQAIKLDELEREKREYLRQDVIQSFEMNKYRFNK